MRQLFVVGWLMAFVTGLLFVGLGEWALAGGTQAIDRLGFAVVRGPASQTLTDVMFTLTRLADTGAMLLLVAISLAWLLWVRRRDLARFAMAGITGAFALEWGLKLVFARPRPDPADALVLVGGFSFPSGHGLRSVALAGLAMVVTWHLSRSAVVRTSALLVGTAYVLGVATSRVYLGAHYPSDVVGSLLAGICWMLVCLAGSSTIAHWRAIRRSGVTRDHPPDLAALRRCPDHNAGN